MSQPGTRAINIGPPCARVMNVVLLPTGSSVEIGKLLRGSDYFTSRGIVDPHRPALHLRPFCIPQVLHPARSGLLELAEIERRRSSHQPLPVA